MPPSTNAKRHIPTVFENGKLAGKFSEEYQDYLTRVSICHSLVDIARSILDRPDINLQFGTERDGIVRAMTNGRDIKIPKGHPNVVVATKHELAHIYFKSDIEMRLEFVKALINDLAPVRLHSATYSKLLEDLCFIVNVFDDVRVNSLWGLIYPGDGRDMDNWYGKHVAPQMKERAEYEYAGGDIDRFAPYAILLVLGQEAKSTKWGKYKDDIVAARNDVHYKSFPALLLIVRDLLTKVAKDLLEEAPDMEDAGATSQISAAAASGMQRAQALEKLVNGNSPGKDFDHHDADFDFDQPVSASLDQTKVEELKRIRGQNLDDREGLRDLLQRMESDAIEEVEALQQKMTSIQTDNDEVAIRRKVKGDVKFHDVTTREAVFKELSPEERNVVSNWKMIFRRVTAALEKRVAPEGYELVQSLYIQQKINKQPFVCYRRPQTGRGFRVTLLIDLSFSMKGSKFRQAESLYKVLRAAMDFPFVELEVLGFNSLGEGSVDIVRFDRKVSSLSSALSRPYGLTPLPQAIQVAGQSLKRTRHQSFLFVITDGLPAFQIRDPSTGRAKEIPARTLINMTSAAVAELAADKVQTYCLMVDDTATADVMDTMFGANNWKTVKPETLFADAFELIKDRFLRYLRTR